MDLIQALLQRWVDDGDVAALNQAISALSVEWKGIIRRFLQGGTLEEIEDLLQEAVEKLVLDRHDKGPAAMGPRGVKHPRAWRRKILRNWLCDRVRKKRRRDHALDGLANEWSPKTERMVWLAKMEARRNNEPPPGPLVERDVPRRPPESLGSVELLDQRRRVLEVLPELTVLRRVLVSLVMRADPFPWAEDLARFIADDVDSVMVRMAHALAAPHDANHDLLSMAMVRVVYPPPVPFAQARDAARQALTHAQADLRRRLT